MTEEALIEALAEQEHESWANWMKWLFVCCEPGTDGALIIPAVWVERWQRQMDTSYADLNEREQDADRDEVRQFLSFIYRYAAERAS